MVADLKVAHGPWRPVFKGTWSEHEVHLYENDDKLSLTAVFEQEKGKVTGVILLLNQYYVVDRDADKLAGKVGGYSLVMEKHYPSFTGNYLAVSPGPKYVKPVGLDEGIAEAFSELQAYSQSVIEQSKALGIDVTEIKHADEEFISHLFSEPTAMLGITAKRVAEAGPEAIAEGAKGVLLGKTGTGEKAEEGMLSFVNTVITGGIAPRKQAMQVLIENCVLNRMTAVVFDTDASFAGMAQPNKKFDFEAYPDLQPIGMPVSTPEIGVDMNRLERGMLREALDIAPGKDALGNTPVKLIEDALMKNRGKIESLKGLAEKIEAEEGERFFAHQARRMLLVTEEAFPKAFDGALDTRKVIAKYVTNMGSVARIDLSAYPQGIREAFIYTVMKALEDELEAKETTVFCFMLEGGKLVPPKPKGALEEGILEMATKAREAKIGTCISAEHEIDIHSAVSDAKTILIGFISEREAAVKKARGKPYRLMIRPALSG